MSKKVTLNVQFEFYPSQDEYLTKYYSDNDEELVAFIQRELEATLSNITIDGTWWHYDTATIDEED